jgi:DNA repair exonuclease SbcCD nuclease subunit
VIIFSDLHLDTDSAGVCLGEILPGIRAACDDFHDREIAMLGDFWHLRYRVDVGLLNSVCALLKTWTVAGITVRLLPGNHDQVDVAGRNALEVLGEIPGVTVFTEPRLDEWGLWVPYRRDPGLVREAIAWAVGRIGNAPLVCFLHHGVAGAIDNFSVATTEGIDPAELPPTVLCICGHYHRHQILPSGRVIYVGSPRQVTSQEAGQPKGFCTWDRAVLRFQARTWGPRFHACAVGVDGQVSLPPDMRPGDEVRVTAPEAACGGVARQLDALGVRHVVTPELAAPEVRLAVGALATLEDYARAYVEREAGDLDKERLVRVFAALTGKDPSHARA